MSGRKLDAVWVFFERDVTFKCNPKAVCKGCGTKLQACVDRMMRHADQCACLVTKGLKLPKVEESTSSQIQPPVALSNPFLQEPAKKKQCLQTSLNVFHTSTSDAANLNMQMCRMVVATNSPFSIVEHPEFKKFCEMLRPEVRLADRSCRRTS